VRAATGYFSDDLEGNRQDMPWVFCLLFGGGFGAWAAVISSRDRDWIARKVWAYWGMPPAILMIALVVHVISSSPEVTKQHRTASSLSPCWAPWRWSQDVSRYFPPFHRAALRLPQVAAF